MKIVLTGERKGQTVTLFSFSFKDGVCQIPDNLVNQASRTVCKYYSAELQPDTKPVVVEEKAEEKEEEVVEEPTPRRGRPPRSR